MENQHFEYSANDIAIMFAMNHFIKRQKAICRRPVSQAVNSNWTIGTGKILSSMEETLARAVPPRLCRSTHRSECQTSAIALISLGHAIRMVMNKLKLSPEANMWKRALDAKYISLVRSGTLVLVSRQVLKDVIYSKWAYKIKNSLKTAQ